MKAGGFSSGCYHVATAANWSPVMLYSVPFPERTPARHGREAGIMIVVLLSAGASASMPWPYK